MKRTLVLVAIVLALSVPAKAQTADATKAKLEVGAAFLKAGDIELATKTFTQILDADATNWQARALLAVAYLSQRDLTKVEAELKRLRAQNAPAPTIALLDRQLAGVRRSYVLRDELTGLLGAGKVREVQAQIDGSDLPPARKQLLRAFVATQRGEFDEARKLTGDTEFAAFNASIVKRAADFQAAREKSLVALNVLGYRYCGLYFGEMRRCKDQAPLPPAQQAVWEEIRTGAGKVRGKYLQERAGKGFFGDIGADVPEGAAAVAARVETALPFMANFVALAPLHPESLRVAVVLSLYSGSLDAVRAVAATRSVNAAGTWALSTRPCGRGDISGASYSCVVGREEVDKDQPKEGLVVVDTQKRVLRYHVVSPSSWLTGLLPKPGAVQFEISFNQIAVISSKPEAKNPRALSGSGPWLGVERDLFDFGNKKVVPMSLDFTFPLHAREALGLAFKGMEDVSKVLGELVPSAKVDFNAEFKTGGGFLGALGMGLAAVSTVGGTAAGNPALVLQGQQLMAQQQQLSASNEQGKAAIWNTLADLKSQDGKSMVDAAFEDDALKKDLEALLNMTLQ